MGISITLMDFHENPLLKNCLIKKFNPSTILSRAIHDIHQSNNEVKVEIASKMLDLVIISKITLSRHINHNEIPDLTYLITNRIKKYFASTK